MATSITTTNARKNQIDPELRAGISRAVAESGHDVKVCPSTHDHRPLFIVTTGIVPPHVLRVMNDHGYRVVSVSHFSERTHVHFVEA